MQKFTYRKAFSLVEISIVILIIGVLIAGINQSTRLVREMRVAVARNFTKSSEVNSIRDLTFWAETSGELSVLSGTGSLATGDLDDNVTFSTWVDINPQKTEFEKYNLTSNANVRYIHRGINGLPSLRFSGNTNSFLYSPKVNDSPIRSRSRSYSMFAVFKAYAFPTAAAGSLSYVVSQGTATSAANNSGGIGIDTSTAGFIGNANNSFVTNRLALNKDYCFGFVLRTGATPITVYSNINGNSITSTPTLSSAASLSIRDNNFVIGGSPYLTGTATTTLPFNGLISEVIIFDRSLKAAEAMLVYKYLARKYNLQ